MACQRGEISGSGPAAVTREGIADSGEAGLKGRCFMKAAQAGLSMVAVLALLGAAPQARYQAKYQAKYQEGQVWEYRTRPVDAGSLLRIQKIEALDVAGKEERIYHLSVIGLHFPGAPDLGGVLQHIPVSQGTLDASVTRLASTNPAFPDPSPGIAEWRRARGGVFTIPVAEIVASVETMLSGAAPQPAG
jgi:hypothetical protein